MGFLCNGTRKLWRNRTLGVIAAFLCLLAIGACGSGSGNDPQVPLSKHVVLVMVENTSFPTVVGNDAIWPNLNALMAKGALPTNYYANVHYSIGNYFSRS